MSWRSGIHIKSRFTPEPQRHIGADGAAHGALAVLAVPLLFVPPIVVAVHVAAVQVHPRLLFVYDIFSLHAGEGQGVEAHGALGPGCVDLLPQSLQVLDGRRAREPLGRAPQQRRPAQVDQGAVLQLVRLVLNLDVDTDTQSCHLRVSEEHFRRALPQCKSAWKIHQFQAAEF